MCKQCPLVRHVDLSRVSGQSSVQPNPGRDPPPDPRGRISGCTPNSTIDLELDAPCGDRQSVTRTGEWRVLGVQGLDRPSKERWRIRLSLGGGSYRTRNHLRGTMVD